MSEVYPIAYYLPQFHPIPENDEWWGKGFTEWTNVAKAKPLFRGHKQPHLPADLGYYDLRVPEVRELQADMARRAGIKGFCYWHYWFGNGKRLLERPFNEVLRSGKPDFPFCLAWANETWSGIWHGVKDKILIKQEYPGIQDYEKHFYELLPAFRDARYIKINGEPLFVIYNPTDIPDLKKFCNVFKELAVRNNLKGLHLVANNIKNGQIDWNPRGFGFDAYTISAHNRIIHDGDRALRLSEEISKSKKSLMSRGINFAIRQLIKDYQPPDTSMPYNVFRYDDAARYFLLDNKLEIDSYPTVITGWDNTPRSGYNGLVLTGYTPEGFRKHLQQALSLTGRNINKILFVKSWNEWAEGNYLEPEKEHGTRFLEVFREELDKMEKGQSFSS